MLARQVRRHLAPGGQGAADGLLANPAVLRFLDAVDAAYRDADREGVVLSHSLETMSAELLARQAQLRRSAEAYRLLFERNPMPMLVHAPDTLALLAANDAAVAHYGWRREELLAMTLAELHAGATTADAHAAREAGAEGRAYTAEWHYRSRAGEPRCAELTGHGITWEGAPARLVLAVDVTERRGMEARLRQQAFHDGLTGLANRALFTDRVEHALARGGRAAPPTVLFLDLDGFKRVNDSLGHAAGDELLRQVAGRLVATLRGGDTVARLGGDEFAVLLDPVTPEGAADEVAGRVLAALGVPITVAGREVRVGGSVGIATHRPGATAGDLLRDADAAMYAAKAGGRGRAARFDPEMHRRAVERLELEADLRHAAARGELRVAYQPVCDLATGAVRGVEALARWEHPRHGAVPPSRFVPLAEETGLIEDVGRWVLGQACADLAAWRATLGDRAPGYVAVNVSGRQLDAAGFVDDVRGVLAATGLPGHALTLEITESVIMRDADAVLGRLRALKALGVLLAIDDFGTGYSSLSYLQQFPVDVLKIDKSFVDHVAVGGGGAVLVRTIVALGESLRLRLVAEGIEHPEQRNALRALGCGTGQGFLLGRPGPAPDLARRLAEGAPA